MKIGNLVKSIKILFNRKYVAKSSNPKLALAILREAKDLFIKDSDKYYSGMCVYIGKACDKISNRHQINIPSIKYLIPEFNRDFLKGNVGLYWWPLEDRESRLEAFDKLIKLYSEL